MIEADSFPITDEPKQQMGFAHGGFVRWEVIALRADQAKLCAIAQLPDRNEKATS